MPYDLTITSFSDDLETTINAPTGGAFSLAPTPRMSGRMRVITGAFDVVAAQCNAADIIVLARIPAHCTVQSIKLCNDTLDTGTNITFDVGVYDENQAVISLDAFATDSIIFQSATAAPGTEMRHEAATLPERMGDALWEIAGVANDPGGVMYDIAITIVVVAATPLTGTIGYEIIYTND